MASLRASGTDEQYEEREQLLQDILDLIENKLNQREDSKNEKVAKLDKRESDGEKIRDAAMGRLKRILQESFNNDDENGPTPKKINARLAPSRNPDATRAVEDIYKIVEKTNDLKTKELELTERKLNLDEARFELEKREREAHLKLISSLVGLLDKKKTD